MADAQFKSAFSSGDALLVVAFEAEPPVVTLLPIKFTQTKRIISKGVYREGVYTIPSLRYGEFTVPCPTGSPNYDITADETITATIPGSALTGGVAIEASSTFVVTADAAAGIMVLRRRIEGI